MKNKILLLLLILNYLGFSQNNKNSFKIQFSDTNQFASKLVRESVKNIINKTTLEISKYTKTSIPINVIVIWDSLENNVGASCKASSIKSNFDNCPYKNVSYPIALAEKIAVKELNSSTEPDIIMNINKNANWYLGTDGNPDSTLFDLYTILLHELCHGIGIQSNFVDTNGNKGGYKGLPYIFDTFIEDKNSIKLCDTLKYQNLSQDLYRAFISESLYFGGEYVKILNDSNKKANIYAPKTFSLGNSLSHLDNNKYPKKDINSLLTYTKSRGESIHTVGPIAEGILADIGWSDFLITVNTFKDTEDTSFKPEVKVYLDSIFNPSSLTLHWSLDNFVNGFVVPFKQDSTNNFTAIIPNYFPYDRQISYYITAKNKATSKDTNIIEVRIPKIYPINYYSFKIGKDKTPPYITFNPFLDIRSDDDSLYIRAIANDNVGIGSIWVEFLNNNKKDSTKLERKINSAYYSGSIPTLDSVKIIQYRITAIDSSKSKNKISTQLYYFNTQSLPYKRDDINLNANSESLFTLDNFFIGSDKMGSSALQTNHESLNGNGYNRSTKDGDSILLTATLNKPLVIQKDHAYLQFDEIVLVELADEGFSYPSYNFWDYCIIKGSKDKINWYPFEGGYKTELYPDWVKTYKSKTTSQTVKGQIHLSSTATPNDSNLYHTHIINLLQNKRFRKNDTIYVQFSLKSDFYTNGWGWSIKNIRIQPLETELTNVEESKTIIFPTISSDFFTLKTIDKKIKNIESISTIGIKNDCFWEMTNVNQYFIKIMANQGLYFLKITFEDGETEIVRVILKSSTNE